MSRSEATYVRLPVTIYGIRPESKDDYHSFFENAKAKRARRTLSFTILSTFIVVFLVLSLASLPSRPPLQPTANEVDPQGKGDYPDFSKYSRLHTLSAEDLRLDGDGRRLIIVGDVHGMNHQLQSLLKKLSYHSLRDTFMHVGDITTKGPHSNDVISFMAEHNITGVRGNHDQKVVEWRGWIHWIEKQKGGKEWLKKAEESRLEEPEPRDWRVKWKVPKGWQFLGDHYQIARKMTNKEYEYMLNLPLFVHLQPLHFVLVHAGLLPSDPSLPLTSRRQPLSKRPSKSFSDSDEIDLANGKKVDPESLRTAQELRVINHIPQNRDPFTPLNMRTLVKKHQKHQWVVSRRKKGRRWSEIWNEVMHLCRGFELTASEGDAEKGEVEGWVESGLVDWGSSDKEGGRADDDVEGLKKKGVKLPCEPTTVLYGHAAAWGLDLKPWSKGLDTGCVYGRRLTALVLGLPSDRMDDIDLLRSRDPDAEDGVTVTDIAVGDSDMQAKYKVKIVSIRCPLIEDIVEVS